MQANKQPAIAKRLEQIQPFYVMDILAEVKKLEAAGEDIIHMEVGEPDFATDAAIMQAAMKALQDGESHYTAPAGLSELRQKLAQYYSEQLNCQLDWQNIAITLGASAAIQLVLSTILDPGDEIILTDPGYPCNRHVVRLLSARDINVPLDKNSAFVLTPEMIEPYLTPRTKAVMIASPANPSATVYSRQQIKQLADYCEQKGLHFIVDEIYQGLQYGTEIFSAAEISSRIWVINSFSKYFGMTGFRLGWLLAPQGFMPAIEKLIQNLFLAPVTIAQHAAIAALSAPVLARHKKKVALFQQRRDYLMPQLQSLGFDIVAPPDGAFYLYTSCRKWSMPASHLAQKILQKARVAVTPGKDFAIKDAEDTIRFAYTTDIERIKEGVSRLKYFFEHDL